VSAIDIDVGTTGGNKN